MHDLILSHPGWDDNLGPTHPSLNQIYRKIILDPSMTEEYRRKIDVLSSIQSRVVAVEEKPPHMIDGVLQSENAYVTICHNNKGRFCDGN